MKYNMKVSWQQQRFSTLPLSKVLNAQILKTLALTDTSVKGCCVCSCKATSKLSLKT